jgi:flagellar motor component MotA
VLIIGGFLLGALLGPLRAMKLGGRKLDALHYGAAFALIGTLIGLFATIIIARLA